MAPRLDFHGFDRFYVILDGLFGGLDDSMAHKRDFSWLSLMVCDLRWICLDFMDSRGPRSGGGLQPD